jgi:3-methyladenine DNA glycosylase/8-oxoguanine DNA glycosylase
MASMHSFALRVQMPFDWESLLAFMRVRATPGAETVTERAYSRTITDSAGPQTLSVTYDPAGACLRIAYSGDAGTHSVVERRAKQIFKPEVSTPPIETSLRRDKCLAEIVARQPGLRVPGGWSAFELPCAPFWGSRSQCPLPPR